VRAIERLFASVGRSQATRPAAEPPRTILLGAEASDQRLAELARKSGLSEYRYLHFATHGLIDEEHPARSCLILSRIDLPDPLQAVLAGRPVYDGRLTVQRMANEWKLNADLVTLSACETGLGKEGGGEGFVGFAQVLLFRGARSVVLSLWKVDDTATMLLMTRFYEDLLGAFEKPRSVAGQTYRAGQAMPKAAALREARLWLRDLTQAERAETLRALPHGDTRGQQEPALPVADSSADRPYAHPHFWGAFILVGDPE